MKPCKTLAIIAIVASIVLSTNALADTTAEKAFASAPRNIFPTLSANLRLDMIDYQHSSDNIGVKNTLGGNSKITAASPSSLSIKISDASTCQLAVIPAGNDSIIAVISTVATPVPDSKLDIYSSDWSKNLTASVFSKPNFKDWLSPEGRKNAAEAESLIPFLLISYTYNPYNQQLTLTNNTSQFLSREVYEIVKPYILPQIIYQFNGKNFNRLTK